MMKKKTAEISKKIERILRGILTLGIAWSLAAGGLMIGCALLGVEYTAEVICLTAVCGVLLHQFTQRGGKTAVVLLLTVLAGSVLLLLLAGDHLLNGFLAIYNETAETLGRQGICFLNTYTLLSDASTAQDKVLVLGIAGILNGILSHAAVYKCKKRTAAFCFLLALTFWCIRRSGMPEQYIWSAGTAVFVIFCTYQSHRKSDLSNGSSMTLYVSVAAAAICLSAVWISSFWLPQERYEEPKLVSRIREKTVQLTDQLRYKKETVNTLPKGKLSAADTWETTEKTALRVTMSEPDSLYLRGYVGSVYEGDCWKELDPEVYYENQALLYWLQEWGISGNTQLSALRENLKDKRLSSEATSIRIENINADSEYLYLPYELQTYALAEETEAQKTLAELWEKGYGENAVHSGGLFGKRDYSYTSLQNLVKDFPQAAAQSYLYRRNNSQAQYTQAESYYNVFVYENYTQLPQSVQTLLKQELGYAGEQEDGHADYRSVIQKIRSYLEKHITYSNYAEALPEDVDFLSFFLTESQMGSAVHYATAAALMFRYYGIPARYAEGYLITPEDAQKAVSEEPFDLTGSRGHAWTEIYVDGLGWVPIEMTPEYYDVMEQPDLSRGLQTDSSVVIQPPKKQETEQQQRSSEALKEHLSQIILNFGKLLLGLLIAFDLFCVFVFLYLLVRRAAANVKRRRQFHSEESSGAVCAMVSYMERLMQELDAGLNDETASAYQGAYQIGQKAAFSPHCISEEERSEVEAVRKKLMKLIKKKRGWYEKWILKYIERLY